MAKSLGIFKKRPDEGAAPDEEETPSRPPRSDSKGKGALVAALDELEAEEVEKSPKLFRQSDRLEDELIQFLDEKPKVKVAEPEPPEFEEVKAKIVEPHVRKERVLSVPVKIGGSTVPPASEPARPTQRTKAEPAPVIERQLPPSAPKTIEISDEPPASHVALSKKAVVEEDSIYEMIKSQTFAISKPQVTQRAPLRSERPRAEVQRPILRAPAPMPEPKMRPPMEVTVQPVEAPRQRIEPAQAQAKRKFTAGAAILTQVKHDFMTLTLMMRWVEFLFERVTREKFSLVLDYYVEVGWISEEVRSEVIAYARGEMQDVTKYMPHEEEISDETPEIKGSSVAVYKKVDDWRLSADDHLKSLLFITKMAGVEVDKDKLNTLEQTIKRFKENLEGFYGI